MKVFFDTNVYISQALRGKTADEVINGALSARWKIITTEYVLAEITRVLTEKFEYGPRLTALVTARIRKYAAVAATPSSRHRVPDDPNDSPVLQGALTGSDWLVTNDNHLLELDPYEGLRIVQTNTFRQVLVVEGFLPPFRA